MEYEEIVTYFASQKEKVNRYDRSSWDDFVKRMGLRLSFPFIHITGSNDKENVSHYLSHIYQAAEYKVGLFTHLAYATPLEEIQISGEPIPEEEYVRIFNQYQKDFERASLSVFEIETFIAYTYFNEQKVSLALVEAGLGGDLDATVILGATPVLSIITNVSLEHTAVLGTTLSEIAAHKVGIVKEKSMVLLGKVEETVSDIVRIDAQRKGSLFFTVDDYHFEKYRDPFYEFNYRPYEKLEILSSAHYLLESAALALEAVKLLRLHFPLSESAIRHGLIGKPLPCRMERFHNVLIDESHNVAGIDRLMDSVTSYANGTPVHVLFGSMRDKNISVELPRLGKDAAEIVLTTFDHPYAKDEMSYFLYEADYAFREDWKMALNGLLQANQKDLILITGSSHFAKLARDYVKKVLQL